MSSLCLSVPSNLRCTNLLHWQAVILFIVPSFNVLFAAKFLHFNWKNLRPLQWAFVIDVIVYFFLALIDFLLRRHDGEGQPLYLFTAYDEAIGILTIFPIFMYMVGIIMLAYHDIIPLTFQRELRRPVLCSLIAFLPFVLVMNAISGLIGITYGQSATVPPTVSSFYASPQAQFAPYLLSDLTIILLAFFQLCVAGSCVFYVYRAHKRGVGGGVIPGFKYLTVGLMLGAGETLLGLGTQAGGGFLFWLILTRRVLRQAGRGVIFLAFVLGTNVDQGFVLFPSGTQVFSTGTPPAVEHLRTTTPPGEQTTQIDEPQRPPRIMSRIKERLFPRRSPKGFTAFDSTQVALAREMRERDWNKPGARVIVNIPFKDPMSNREVATPMLDVRFSALNMPNPSELLAGFRSSVSSKAEQGGDHDLERGQGPDPAAARATGSRTRLQLQTQALPRPFGSSSKSPSTGSSPPRRRRPPSAVVGRRPWSLLGVSVARGADEGGQWLLQANEADSPSSPRGRKSGSRHTAGKTSQDSMALSQLTTRTSATDSGAVSSAAEIVEARSVTVSTERSTFLYPNESKRARAGPEVPTPPRTRREPPPLPAFASSALKGLSDTPVRGTGGDEAGPSRLSPMITVAEDGEYFALQPETLGADIRQSGTVCIRTPTVIVQPEARRSVLLEHGHWAEDPDIIEEEEGEERDKSKSLRELQMEFSRYKHEDAGEADLSGAVSVRTIKSERDDRPGYHGRQDSDVLALGEAL